MDRVIITKAMVGICYMQVCAAKDATDEEILEVCNRNNPSGTSQGWCAVIRKDEKGVKPVTCGEYPDRTHFLIEC